MKITVSVTKSLDQDCGLCYLHLPIFSLHTHTRTHTHTHKLLFCCKIKSSCAGPHKLCAGLQPSMWRARKWCYAYSKIHVQYWFLYVKIIWIYQFVCLFFFCPMLGWFYHVVLPVRGINRENSTVHWCYQPVAIENYFSQTIMI